MLEGRMDLGSVTEDVGVRPIERHLRQRTYLLRGGALHYRPEHRKLDWRTLPTSWVVTEKCIARPGVAARELAGRVRHGTTPKLSQAGKYRLSVPFRRMGMPLQYNCTWS